MRDNIDDAHEACSTEELNRERPQLVEGDSKIYSLQETLAEKDDKVSSLEQGLLGKEGEDKVDVPDDIMQEEVEDKPIELDGIHPSEQLDEEIPQSGEDVAKLSSLPAEFVGEKEKEPISELSVSTAAVNEIKHEKVEQELSEEQLKEETAASAGKSTEVSSLQQEQIDEDNKISALPEDSAEKDENVSSLKEESAEKDQEESAEKEEDDEVDTDEGGPAKAAGRRTGSKQKRGRPQVANGRRTRAPSKPKEDEELCFICFDGGDLVVCDHRGCPKVYHPSCVNRDEEYFKAKGQWTCGWHICSSCQKSARYMCYTCTYSLCRGCIKESDFVCVRGNKGFCKECMKTVMLIEMNKHADDTMGVIDFDDKTSWMYLFKDYWVDLKAKLSLTTEELIEARNPLKETNTIFGNEKHLNKKRAAKWNEEPLENSGNASDDQGGSASSSSKRYKENASLRKKVKKRSRNTTNREDQVKRAGTGQISNSEDIEWASKELLEFVEHMKDGDRSVLSQFDVQALLLEYIKQNNLRDPRRKSQIICDSRLWALFGKSRVGHLEMLKLLEPHFLIKEASPIVTDDNQGGVVDPEPSQTDADGNSDASTKISDLRRKPRRRVEEKGLMNPDDYAAIDVHNVSLMYLRRNLMEDFLDDDDTFKENVVGAFVRIRISGSTSAKDMYRLVQVVGTGKAAGKYKTGKKTTDITLEILNLNKREVITIDLISNQEFTEEECERLRQSVKCGFIDRPKVAEVQEKARALHTVRVDDWLESEKARLGHLRDRASEKEKLQLLSTPEERIRRLNEVPEIHVDPNMDPDYDSTEDEEGQDAKREDNKKQKPYFKGRDEFSMGREGFNAHKNSLAAWDSNRNTSKAGVQGIVLPTVQADRTYGFSRNQGNDAHSVSSPKTPKNEPNATGMDAVLLKNAQPVAEPGQARGLTFETVPQQANIVSSSTSENEKMWHYQDPAGKVQGPFSMTQLRKWNASKFFPANLRIWRSSEKQEDSILLTDALSGKLHSLQMQQLC
ncbi:uncharacterized protein A4U43_C08F130 [Asparagus officinalis]|nr:uncharacterized protein A4U43_C08F130 [Asparagus officinalis]